MSKKPVFVVYIIPWLSSFKWEYVQGIRLHEMDGLFAFHCLYLGICLSMNFHMYTSAPLGSIMTFSSLAGRKVQVIITL